MSIVKIIYSRALTKLLKAIEKEIELIAKKPWWYGIESAESLRERLLEFLQESDEFRDKANRVFLHAFKHDSIEYEFLVVNHVKSPGTPYLTLTPIISVIVKLDH